MRLILPLAFASALVLWAGAALGYGSRAGLAPLAHVTTAAAATLGVLFSQTMVIVFFLGIGHRVRALARERAAARRLLQEHPLPASPVPLAAAALAVTMAAFVLGGGAHTGALPPWLHGGVAILAASLQTFAALREWGAYGRVRRTVQLIEDRLGAID